MGQIYYLNSEDIGAIIDDILQNNDELQNWNREDERIREELTSIFYARDDDESNHHQYNSKYYSIGRKAGLYVRDSQKHICAKAIVLDFIKVIFAPSTWNCVKAGYCKIKEIEDGELNVGDIIVLIDNIRNVITKNVVNLEKEYFCFYLQMITHFMEHREIVLEDLLGWLPVEETECSYLVAVSECQFRESGVCMLKKHENYKKAVRDILDIMVDRKILLNNQRGKDKYKINY